VTAASPSGAEQDPLNGIVVALVRHKVDFIAIGGWAVRAGAPKAALDDVLDAAAAAWTARRIASDDAICLGESEFDETGYPMHIGI